MPLPPPRLKYLCFVGMPWQAGFFLTELWGVQNAFIFFWPERAKHISCRSTEEIDLSSPPQHKNFLSRCNSFYYCIRFLSYPPPKALSCLRTCQGARHPPTCKEPATVGSCEGTRHPGSPAPADLLRDCLSGGGCFLCVPVCHHSSIVIRCSQHFSVLSNSLTFKHLHHPTQIFQVARIFLH